jgi:hypothetical protein
MPLIEYTIRQLVQPWIRMWVKEGLSGVEMLGNIRRVFGMAYRLEDFYADVRRYKEMLEKLEKLAEVPQWRRIPQELYQESDLITAPYRHRVKIKYEHPETKEPVEQSWVVDTNRRHSRVSIEEKAVESYVSYHPEVEEATFEVEFEELLTNPELY